MYFERENIVKLIAGTIAFSLFSVIVSVCVLFFVPEEKVAKTKELEVIPVEELAAAPSEDALSTFVPSFEEEYPELEITNTKREDSGLVLYRQAETRSAVEWYYSRVVNSREIADAILRSADEYSIPLSLAFALAHTESKFRVNAMHKNTNGTVDRGLFQLNNSSFPKLEESDFYDPKISAHYGLSHLRFCLNSAGNEIAALAMYNAGTNKVRRNNTPQITLNYISQIQNYKNNLEENFAAEVLSMYRPDTQAKMLAKLGN